jgi:hypothetical protein
MERRPSDLRSQQSKIIGVRVRSSFNPNCSQRYDRSAHLTLHWIANANRLIVIAHRDQIDRSVGREFEVVKIL